MKEITQWCESKVHGKYHAEKTETGIWVYVEGHMSLRDVPDNVKLKSVNNTDTQPYDFLLRLEK